MGGGCGRRSWMEGCVKNVKMQQWRKNCSELTQRKEGESFFFIPQRYFITLIAGIFISSPQNDLFIQGSNRWHSAWTFNLIPTTNLYSPMAFFCTFIQTLYEERYSHSTTPMCNNILHRESTDKGIAMRWKVLFMNFIFMWASIETGTILLFLYTP